MHNFNYVWPIALVVFSNVLYQVCAKGLPSEMDPFASLTITYLVGTIFSFILYYVMNRKGNIIEEYSKTNAAPIVLGLVLVGLEVGCLFAYKYGWEVSRMSLVSSSCLAVALIFVGWLGYHEILSWNKLLGTGIVLVGLYFVNFK